MPEDKFDKMFDPKFYEAYENAMKECEREEEDFWNSLSKEQQLLAFCAVTRRLKRGELDEQQSYRGILYGVFGFGMESYTRAQNAGFIELHNSIVVDDGK